MADPKPKPKPKPTPPAPLDAQIDSVRPWDSPIFRPPQMPPGQAIGAEIPPEPPMASAPTGPDDALALAAQLEALKAKSQHILPDWILNALFSGRRHPGTP